MSKQSFEHLLEKYLKGQCTPAEKRLVEQWYELVGRDAELPLSEAEWQATKAEIWLKVKSLTQTVGHSTLDQATTQESKNETALPSRRGNQKPILLTPYFSFLVKTAASVALVLGLGVWLWQKHDTDSSQVVKIEKEGQVEWQNQTAMATIVKLSDGSRVRLQPHARMAIPEAFSDSLREIVLTGDAFFDVTPDPHRPFMVRVGNVVTRVLGTSFWVLNRANRRVEVEVKTGKVTVFERMPKDAINNGVLLTPNHKVTYFADDQHFVTGIVEKPEIIKTPDAVPVEFLFENTPLTEVIATLEKGYGIKIELTNEALKNCNLTGDLDNLEMHDKLRLICQSLGASYNVRGTSILISGKGCD